MGEQNYPIPIKLPSFKRTLYTFNRSHKPTFTFSFSQKTNSIKNQDKNDADLGVTFTSLSELNCLAEKSRVQSS